MLWPSIPLTVVPKPGTFSVTLVVKMGFPGGSDGKESCNEEDVGSMPGLGSSPGEGNSYPLQYSSLANFMDRGAWQATVHGVTKSQTRLSNFHFHFNRLLYVCA